MDECEFQIVAFCATLQTRMLEKYRKGKAEHGGKWSELDCVKEINAEVLDILNYHCIAKAKDDNIGKRG